jgi:hypothetical protein
VQSTLWQWSLTTKHTVWCVSVRRVHGVAGSREHRLRHRAPCTPARLHGQHPIRPCPLPPRPCKARTRKARITGAPRGPAHHGCAAHAIVNGLHNVRRQRKKEQSRPSHDAVERGAIWSIGFPRPGRPAVHRSRQLHGTATSPWRHCCGKLSLIRCMVDKVKAPAYSNSLFIFIGVSRANRNWTESLEG